MKQLKKILIVAAHPDDEVIGCGGSIPKFIKNDFTVDVMFMTNGISSRFEANSEFNNLIRIRKDNALRANKIMGVNSVEFFDFPDNSMDVVPLLELAKAVERIVFKIKPSIVITHSNNDLNIDHRLTHQSVLIATRPKPNNLVKKLMFFEIPSSTNWNPSAKQFNPIEYVDITEFIDIKEKALLSYESEICKFPHTRSLEGILSLNTYRGTTVGVSSAEAFEIGRILN